MKSYCIDKIRNVVLLGAGGSGKTTVVEAMAFATALKNKLGSVTEGNTVSDYDTEEIKRGFSINTSVVTMDWEGCHINILDTPGNLDFVGEREAAVSAADAAVIVINGKKGVEAGTVKAWKLCDLYNLPRLVFVTAMDDDDASYRQVVEQLIELYGKKISPFHQPIRQNGKFVGYVNITKMKARKFTGIAEYEEIDIPDYSQENLAGFREQLIESVASTSDELMEKYFEEQEFTQEEIDEALKENCWNGSLVPVTMGSGLNVQGIFMLLNDIIRYLPYPRTSRIATNHKTRMNFECLYDCDAPLVARVFKTISDPFIGRYSFVKVYSGIINKDSTVYNSSSGSENKVPRLYAVHGKEMAEIPALRAGEIGAIPKLNGVSTGDTLSSKLIPIEMKSISFSKPYTYRKYSVPDKNDEEKILNSLSKLLEENNTIQLINDEENGQTIICGMGEQQLDVLISQLLNRYKINITLEKPTVAYKETITRKAEAQGRYKKQTGGHGQFGDVTITFEPMDINGEKFLFEERIVGGVVPKKFFPAIEKGIGESMVKGLLASYPVVGIKATLTDGSFHNVDSSEQSFKMAAMQAFRNAFMEAEPVLLEPIMSVKIYTPDRFSGDITNDLKTRRGKVIGIYAESDGETLIDALVPYEELFEYGSVLRSITGGYGDYEYEFAKYSRADDTILKRQISNRKE